MKKIMSVILILSTLSSILCINGCSFESENKTKPTQTEEILNKDEKFDELKQWLKDNGTYSDDEYFISSNDTLGMKFALVYDSLHDNICMHGIAQKDEHGVEPKVVIFFSNNESYFNYTVGYGDYVYGSGKMLKNEFSDAIKTIDFYDYEYDEDMISEYEFENALPHLKSMGAGLINVTLKCFMYEMLVNGKFITPEALGFSKFKPENIEGN